MQCSVLFVNMNTFLVATDQWNFFEVIPLEYTVKPVKVVTVIINQVAGIIKVPSFCFQIVTDLPVHVYTASKVKHHLNIFLEKTVKLSKYEFILVTCLKRDKVVTIYSNF